MLKIAHLTDIHMAPLPVPSIGELLGKRVTGYLSWRLRRNKVHLRSILDIVVADLKSFAPDHVALTGDLINLALPAEYLQAGQWLQSFGPGNWITLAPGNHDAYVATRWNSGPALWADYFTSEVKISHPGTADLVSHFPLVRYRRNIAIIAVCTAIPTAIGMATGMLGKSQLASLRLILGDTRQRGFYRLLLIHHPPLKHLAGARKELLDAEPLQEILESEGCELVLYGHNHRHQQAEFPSRFGPIPMFGLPSASQIEDHGCTAAWSLHDIKRQNGNWTTDVTIRSYRRDTNSMETMSQLRLDRQAGRKG